MTGSSTTDKKTDKKGFYFFCLEVVTFLTWVVFVLCHASGKLKNIHEEQTFRVVAIIFTVLFIIYTCISLYLSNLFCNLYFENLNFRSDKTYEKIAKMWLVCFLFGTIFLLCSIPAFIDAIEGIKNSSKTT
jgi:hypothetical protein